MKKLLVLLIILILTGCGNDNMITCKNKFNEKFDDQNLSYDAKVEIIFDGDKISDATAEMVFDDQKNATNMCSIMKLIESDNVKINCNGKQVKIVNYHKIDDNVKTKAELVKTLEEDGFKCK